MKLTDSNIKLYLLSTIITFDGVYRGNSHNYGLSRLQAEGAD